MSDDDHFLERLRDGESRRSFLRTGALLGGAAALGGAGSAPGLGASEEDGETSANESEDGDATDAAGEIDLSDADLAFVQEMIPHHRGALAMARLVPERSDREELRELAPEMIEAQREQIGRMEAILLEAEVDYETDDVPESSEIPGMPSADGMAVLRELEGEEFDATFINLMTAHHRGAVILARRRLEASGSDRIQDLARRIVAAQLSEIHTMYEWYVDWMEPPAGPEDVEA